MLVQDIFVGAESSAPIELTDLDGELFFAATNAENGAELWKSDGTDTGTVLVQDINVGSGGRIERAQRDGGLRWVTSLCSR